MPPASRPRVVVIGGGFGGLEAAKALAGAPVDLTVIDRQNHHTFQPLLYQVATAALSPADIAWPIRGLLGRQANVRVVMATVTGIDTERREVRADGLTAPYDYLVIATGARPSYFGHDDWAKAAPELKRIEDATRIRQRLLLAFERAELMDDVGRPAAAADLRGGRRRPHRRRTGRRHRRGRPRGPAARFQPDRSAHRAGGARGSRSAPAGHLRRSPVCLCAARPGAHGRRGDDRDGGDGVRRGRRRPRVGKDRRRHGGVGRGGARLARRRLAGRADTTAPAG